MRRRFLWLLIGAVLALPVDAQQADRIRTRTAAQLTALDAVLTAVPPQGNRPVYSCTDCLGPSSCTTGGGSFENICYWDADSDEWRPLFPSRADDTYVELVDGGGTGGYFDFAIDGQPSVFGLYPDDIGVGGPSVFMGGVRWEEVQLEACSDSGDGSPGTVTITPLKPWVWIGSFDSDGCEITMAEPTGELYHGFVVEIVNHGGETVTLADSAGNVELQDDATWESDVFAAIKLRYVFAPPGAGFGQWVEMSRSNPSSSGGGGDITQVWGCTTGDCSALTGAAGDSLDAGSADSIKPATRSTSLPGTCAEGQTHQDTDSGGTEWYVCTASNTWTKTIAATDNVATATALAANGSNCSSGEGAGGVSAAGDSEDCTEYCQPDGTGCPEGVGSAGKDDYDPERFSSHADLFAVDYFTDGTPTQTWINGNHEGSDAWECDATGDACALLITATNDNIGAEWAAMLPGSGDFAAVFDLRVNLSALQGSRSCGVAVITEGTTGSPTEIYTYGFARPTGLGVEIQARRMTSYSAVASTPLGAAIWGANAIYISSVPTHFAITYVDSTDVMSFFLAMDGGYNFQFSTSVTDSSYPDYLGVYCWSSSTQGGQSIMVRDVRVFDATFPSLFSFGFGDIGDD